MAVRFSGDEPMYVGSVISEVPSPTAKERRSMMNRYVFTNLEPIVALMARKEYEK